MRACFFNDTATTEIYTLSLHDALPISRRCRWLRQSSSTTCRGVSTPASANRVCRCPVASDSAWRWPARFSGGRRSEEHTSELQSRQYLVCRLLLEKKTGLSHHLILTPA